MKKKKKAFGFTSKDSSSDDEEPCSSRTASTFDFHKDDKDESLAKLQYDRMLVDPGLKKNKKKLTPTE